MAAEKEAAFYREQLHGSNTETGRGEKDSTSSRDRIFKFIDIKGDLLIHLPGPFRTQHPQSSPVLVNAKWVWVPLLLIVSLAAVGGR